MKKSLEMIAETVVIRAPSDDGKYVFTVDGEDFPWLVGQDGPSVSQVSDDLYVISVKLMLVVAPPDYRVIDFAYTNAPESYLGGRLSVPFIPVIGGVEFPWLLTADGCTLKFGHKRLPELSLGFFAHAVDEDIPITDARGGDVFCASGDLIHADV